MALPTRQISLASCWQAASILVSAPSPSHSCRRSCRSGSALNQDFRAYPTSLKFSSSLDFAKGHRTRFGKEVADGSGARLEGGGLQDDTTMRTPDGRASTPPLALDEVNRSSSSCSSLHSSSASRNRTARVFGAEAVNSRKGPTSSSWNTTPGWSTQCGRRFIFGATRSSRPGICFTNWAHRLWMAVTIPVLLVSKKWKATAKRLAFWQLEMSLAASTDLPLPCWPSIQKNRRLDFPSSSHLLKAS
mmetsp:Transcript_27444/g.53948  ORF Transcript_27444/g.53948 Transcript_27444/m.53948 type:complete len:246 (+) Transcript_27444:871-1608(+)